MIQDSKGFIGMENLNFCCQSTKSEIGYNVEYKMTTKIELSKNPWLKIFEYSSIFFHTFILFWLFLYLSPQLSLHSMMSYASVIFQFI